MNTIAKVYRHRGDGYGRLRIFYNGHFWMWGRVRNAWIEVTGNPRDITLLCTLNNFQFKGQVISANDERNGTY